MTGQALSLHLKLNVKSVSSEVESIQKHTRSSCFLGPDLTLIIELTASDDPQCDNNVKTNSPIFSVSSAGKSLEANALRMMVENSLKDKNMHVYYHSSGYTWLNLSDNVGKEEDKKHELSQIVGQAPNLNKLYSHKPYPILQFLIW